MSASYKLLFGVCVFSALMLNATNSAKAAEVQDIAWNDQQQAKHNFVVLPGKFAELCGKVNASEEVTWRFEATQPTDFNIHYHIDKKVVEPVKLNKVQDTGGSITATETEDYCWMWTNISKATPARVEVYMEKRMP